MLSRARSDFELPLPIELPPNKLSLVSPQFHKTRYSYSSCRIDEDSLDHTPSLSIRDLSSVLDQSLTSKAQSAFDDRTNFSHLSTISFAKSLFKALPFRPAIAPLHAVASFRSRPADGTPLHEVHSFSQDKVSIALRFSFGPSLKRTRFAGESCSEVAK